MKGNEGNVWPEGMYYAGERRERSAGGLRGEVMKTQVGMVVRGAVRRSGTG